MLRMTASSTLASAAATPNDALHDRIGDGYTLLRLGGTTADTSGLERAMRATGAPLSVFGVDATIARDVYGYDLILLRPDLHIAWRGQAPPRDPAGLAAIVTGHSQDAAHSC